MEIRELHADDGVGLRKLILGVYRDSALAMWFESEPSEAELGVLFGSKIDGIKYRTTVDIVSVDHKAIVGECEIVISGGTGRVGVIVEAAHRSHGIGARLLEEGIERCAKLGAKRIIAEVAEENLRAIKFFERHGFETKGISEREFIRDGKRHQVILMERRLI